MRAIPIFLILALSAPTLQAAPAEPIAAEKTDQGLWKKLQRRYEEARGSGRQGDKSYRKKIKEQYEKAKAAGEDVPQDVGEWIKEDLGNLRHWYYKVETIEEKDDLKLQQRLDKLGKERWECFEAVKVRKGFKVFCKRRRRSFLGMIPLRELLRWAGADGGE